MNRRPSPRTLAHILILALLVPLLPGCSPGPEEPHGPDHPHASDSASTSAGTDDHAHEESTGQVTRWTDRHEVFAEFHAPVAGKVSPWITHITDLTTAKPRSQGPITFVLSQGELSTEHPQGAPSSPGIYRPGLVFPKPGTWRVSVRIPADGGPDTVELGTVEAHATDHDAAHATLPTGPDGVAFLKEPQWTLNTRSEPVSRHTLVERHRMPARVRAKPGQRAELRAPLAGRLLTGAPTDAARWMPGQRVEAGQVLARFRPDFSETTAALAEAEASAAATRATLAQAQTTHARLRRLVADQAKPERELQEATLALEVAQARQSAAEALLQTIRQPGSGNPTGDGLELELRSPIHGILVEVNAGPGETLNAGQSICLILNPDTVWIEGRAPESTLRTDPTPDDAILEFPGAAVSPIALARDDRGRRISIGWEVDPTTRTVPILYEVRNPDGHLRIGQSLIIAAATARSVDALAVPEASVFEEGDQGYVFVQVSGETFEKRPVETGIRDRGQIEVRRGLQPGERVVTRGAQAIRLSSLAGALPAHGHSH